MKIPQVLVLSMLTAGSLTAQEVTIIGTTPLTLMPHGTQDSPLRTSSTKTIKLLHVQLSDKAKRTLINKAENEQLQNNQLTMNTFGTDNTTLPKAINLEMNGVPVLDQGGHGTCVTFAITAAIDAALNKGDYVSQLCQLQLGNYIETHGYGISGWDGTWGRPVLSQMDAFGYINKTHESTHGCGGLTKYPLGGIEPETFINVDDFHKISEPLNIDLDAPQISWSELADGDQIFLDDINTKSTLLAVKTALAKGDRVTFGVLLPAVELGNAGAVGTYRSIDDSWILTPEIKHDVAINPPETGHEMVITGYDDDAISYDIKGRQYTGLLTLRNSWGKHSGDHGNFYMSYDYFKLLLLEAYQIRTVN